MVNGARVSTPACVKRPPNTAPREVIIRRFRLVKRVLRIKRNERVDFRLPGLDLIDASLRYLNRGYFFALNSVGDLGQRHLNNVAHF